MQPAPRPAQVLRSPLGLRRAGGGAVTMEPEALGALPGDGAGHGVQSLFEDGDAGIQPVAVAVQRLDGGRQPPGLVLALLGDRLDLLRLPHQVGGGRSGRAAARAMSGWPSRRRSPRRPQPTPHDPSRHSERRSRSSSSASKPLSQPPVSSVSKPSARLSDLLAIRRLWPSQGLPNHAANIIRKCHAGLESERFRGGESVSISGGKRLMTAAAQPRPSNH